MDTIIKSNFKLPHFTPEFKKVYEQRDAIIKEIFNELVCRFSEYHIKHYTTHKPDYSLQSNVVFCCIRLQVKCLKITIKVDSHSISSSLLQLEEYKDASKLGKIQYINFRVTCKKQIDEAFRLIDQAYKISS